MVTVEIITKKDTVKNKIFAQNKYSTTHKVPIFAPSNGVCFSCKEQIYDKISLDKAANEIITFCPHCNYSFVG
jgi:formamidopyrimidine-DNA glycosylase